MTLRRKRFVVPALLLVAASAALYWALHREAGAERTARAPADAEPLVLSDGVASPDAEGALVVLSVPGPTTVRMAGGEASGYEADLARAFAESLGLPVRFELRDTLAALHEALAAGEGHLAAAGLSPAETDGAPALRGAAYKNVQVQLVCRRAGPQPASFAALRGTDMLVQAGSPWIRTLEAVRADVPGLAWEEAMVPTPLALIERVAAGEADCAVAGSDVVALARTRIPDLVVPMNLSRDDRPLAWAVSPRAAELLEPLEAWMTGEAAEEVLEELDERYYGHLEEFDYVDLAVFKRRLATRLPKYDALFRNAAEETLFHWTLLAAQGYQESHWDPAARSPTGVRGLMMLTQPTAREVGVTNRLDPGQSIEGGAAYLSRLFDRLPEGVTGRDRLWFALAAYNVGYGHLSDARKLAREQGFDDDEWHVLDDMLPLLTEPEFYERVRFGYARGGEPVEYVRRIRRYHEALADEIAGVDGRPPLFLRRPAAG